MYGDGEKASEFYESFKESVLENGTIKINQVIPNEKIIEYYGGKIEAKDVSLQPTMQPTQLIVMQPDNIQKILSGEKTTTLRTESFPSGVYNFGGKDFQITNRGLLNVVEAGGVEAISKSEAFAETGPKYQSTKDFLAGKRKLYVYDIAPTSTQPSTSVKPAEQLRLFGNEIMLKDGKAYTADQLNAKMLLAMGYTNQEAGKIIKNNKC